ncbi:hypothetical protein EWB00_004680 [Schistosoma japonicum]|uniref:Uncharacterized protein n=1 Tax=Schistosoma japonicum TaxID=6182 RepID=A0A4Z2DYY2_SCHJA|nr:hypothetical protein EWB00_004680 [Schistosoma japonicum]
MEGVIQLRLQNFVNNYAVIYGNGNVVYNIHGLTHEAEDDFIQQIKQQFHGSRLAAITVIARLCEKDTLEPPPSSSQLNQSFNFSSQLITYSNIRISIAKTVTVIVTN